MIVPRRILPQRRLAETITVIHWNQPFFVTAGFYDDGTLGEVFIDSHKTGGDVEAVARDAGVTISLALQHGAGIEAIQRAVTRDSSGAPSSILGVVIDALTSNTRKQLTKEGHAACQPQQKEKQHELERL